MKQCLFREREAEKDAEDRKRELDEISELKSQIFSDPKLADPASEFQKRLQEREQQFLPDSVRVPQPSARKGRRHPRTTINSSRIAHCRTGPCSRALWAAFPANTYAGLLSKKR